MRRRRRAGRGGVGGYVVWWPGVCDGVQRVMLKITCTQRVRLQHIDGGGGVRAQQL